MSPMFSVYRLLSIFFNFFCLTNRFMKDHNYGLSATLFSGRGLGRKEGEAGVGWGGGGGRVV